MVKVFAIKFVSGLCGIDHYELVDWSVDGDEALTSSTDIADCIDSFKRWHSGDQLLSHVMLYEGGKFAGLGSKVEC